MPNALHVFDMDETLINADCTMVWHQFLVDKGFASHQFIEEDQRLMALYAQGKLDINEYLQFSLSPISHLSKVWLRALIEECIDKHIISTQFPESVRLIDSLKQDNVDILIISASAAFLIEPLAQRMGIKHAIGVDLVDDGQYYHAQISGTPSYREGKVTRLQQWQNKQTKTYHELHFYTDSINDLPLCEYADYVYLVNPCSRLKRYFTERHLPHWTVLNWGSL
ncbi:HAD family hydrolase [Vibrio palustris]|uniref:Haloacid dehalogenase-like hydrolase n=1 Tax=Vibrio palustris TaxID=1918946 RepID=A0A1R4B0K4_9VIBR|nr:HAD family hydrolase [Vibrio palustris]SJL82450.1 haloacid dehalogenase-like hydrolase [Vibrio palustris]